ncbi:MAG: tRNA (guanosine(37)-N1)-methyltransferase TrmD [Bacilli bacterium]|jgi:tRNA (guanine37-N1)-methyltransferase|nr:tRNA (guanosine(37)-N1)-methyltransferase TrmD [Erysipelotrichia bacterium]
MKIKVLTLFPEMFTGFKNNSIIKRAILQNYVSFETVDIRSFSTDKHQRVDSPPIGGGAGLIMKTQPIVDALTASKEKGSHVILLSTRGKIFNQKKAKKLASKKNLIFICGHYEGIDERILHYVDEMISLGDYVLTGGELGAMVISDAIIRLQEGVITPSSLIEESFVSDLLEYPQYTEPYNYDGYEVPDILYSGNHQAIEMWRRKQALLITKTHRPDLFKKLKLSKEDLLLLKELENEKMPAWEKKALEKGHKFIKKK